MFREIAVKTHTRRPRTLARQGVPTSDVAVNSYILTEYKSIAERGGSDSRIANMIGHRIARASDDPSNT